MPPPEPNALRDALLAASHLQGRVISGIDQTIALEDVLAGSILDHALDSLRGRRLLIATAGQLSTALILIAVDGIAASLVLCPPDLKPEHFPTIIGNSGADTIVVDAGAELPPGAEALRVVRCRWPLTRSDQPSGPPIATEWLLLTSGTTGAPKIVQHTFAGLTAAIRPRAATARPLVWATFYDIRRYGGLQILLRSLLGTGSMVLSSSGEATSDHLQRLGRSGVTHISGTPSHWRRALMSPAITAIAPDYIRLSGEIADQTILDALKLAFPTADIGHAYASTEAGVGFEVDDGREGFPAGFIGQSGAVQMKVEEGSLRIKSARAASRYVGPADLSLVDAEGFVETGDMVELRGDRYYFVGRRGGIINVGGLKVHPEEVEAVLNRHPAVHMSRVEGRKNPITGAIVVAAVVLKSEVGEHPEADRLREDILAACRTMLPPHKVPALLRFVPTLEVTPAGKLVRPHA